MSEGDKEFAGGFAPVVQASGDITVREAGALALLAGGNADIKEGGAGFCVVGGDVTIEQGGAGTMIVGGGVQLTDGGVGQMATVEANVADSRIGFLVAAQANLERSEVLITAQQAAVIGAVAGVVFFLLRKLFGRG